MASLPSFAGSSTLKLELEARKHGTEKSLSFSYPRTLTFNQSDGKSEPAVRSLDFLEALSKIQDSSRIATSYYVPILQECIDKSSLSGTQAVHAHIFKTGTYEDLFAMTFLVNVYAKCGTMENARKVFDNLPRRNVVTWTTLMTGYVHNAQPDVAIHVFQEMLETGSYPTNYTLGISLNACAALTSIELGKQIHAYIIKYQIEDDTSVGNSLCSLYSKCGNLYSAAKAFQKIREKNVISWTTVISAFGDRGKAAKGIRFFTEMLSEGVRPNEFTLSSVLSMCCTILSSGLGAQLHSLTVKLGHESSLRIKNSLMFLYLKCGWTDEANKLFGSVKALSLVTWNSMIAGYAERMDLAKDDISAYHSGIEALKLFLKLNGTGMEPDLYTFSSVLTVCSRLVALEQGQQIHALTLKAGYLSDVIVSTALVTMYNKCGSIEKASKAFLEMPTRTLISWTSMIIGFAQNGQTQQALQLFEDMRLAGVRPNQITFVGVLWACSHAGMIDEALQYFEVMQKDYKIRPVLDHYSCLIDMYVRLGRLDEAFEFIKKMDFQPNEFIWSQLLAGCRHVGNTELGFYAAEQLLELKPKYADTYCLLLNAYTSAERWVDVSKVKELMKEEKLEELRDWSWISIKDKIYSFKPNDQTHDYKTEVDDLLDELLEGSKNHGYESVESFHLIDEEDEEKTFSSTFHHSEKIGLAIGLLKSPNAAAIRIIKSTVMCRDCHNFMKAVSSLTARKIIIRDSKRLHKFEEGHCSCGDYSCLL